MKLNAGIGQVYTGHADAIYSLECVAGNAELYSGSGDGFVGSWDIITGSFREPLAKMPATIYSIRKHPSKPLLYVGLQNGVLFVLDVNERSIIRSIQLSTDGLFDLALISDDRYLMIASGEGMLFVLDTTDYSIYQSLLLTDKSIRSLEISPCGRFVIAGCSDHHLYFMEMKEKLHVNQVLPAHDNSVFTATFKEGYVLLTGGRDAMLKQWNWDHETLEWKPDVTIPAHNYTINKISVSPDNSLIATASRDKTVKLWSYEDLKLLKVLDRGKFDAAHTHSVNTLKWLDATTLLSAGDDKRIISWKISR